MYPKVGGGQRKVERKRVLGALGMSAQWDAGCPVPLSRPPQSILPLWLCHSLSPSHRGEWIRSSMLLCVQVLPSVLRRRPLSYTNTVGLMRVGGSNLCSCLLPRKNFHVAGTVNNVRFGESEKPPATAVRRRTPRAQSLGKLASVGSFIYQMALSGGFLFWKVSIAKPE